MSKNIKKALEALNKRYGEGSVQKMSDANLDAKRFSSGRHDLDLALGGGYGVGKIIEIYGESGTGKTGIALEAAASIQEQGGVVAIIDAEHALNTEYCEQIGINVDELYISQPTTGEEAIETIRALIDTGDIDLIIVDSVSNLTPKAVLEGESGEAKIGLQARMMAQGLKMITGASSDNECTIIFLNQLRSTIAMYGPSTTTTGGKALKFYASQRLEIKNKGVIREGDEVIGFKQYIKIVKNKLGTPYKTTDNDIVFGVGIDTFTGFVERLVFEEILIRKGAFYYYNGTKLSQGIKKLRILFDDNPDLVDTLKDELKSK